MNYVDVLIVGAGPTGLTLACLLAARGISFMLIDKNAEPSNASKASNIMPRTLEVFAAMGILPDILAQGRHVEKTSFFNDTQPVVSYHYKYLASHTPYPHLIILPQSQTERILEARLQQLGKAVQRQHILHTFKYNEDTHYPITAYIATPKNNQQTLHCRYMVSCEGASSTIRKQLGLTFTGITYPETFILADVELSHWTQSTEQINAWYHTEGLVVAGPMPETNRWLLFTYLNTTDLPQYSLPITATLVQQLLRDRTPHKNVVVKKTYWISDFKIHCRMVDRYRLGNVFIAGDSAHIHSPIEGLGMNTCIQDVYNLAWKLAQVLQYGAPDSLLNTYETERLPIAKTLLRTTHHSAKMLLASSPLTTFVRNRIISNLLSIPAIQRPWLCNNFQLNISYGSSSPLHKRKPNGRGNRFPTTLPLAPPYDNILVALAHQQWVAVISSNPNAEPLQTTISAQLPFCILATPTSYSESILGLKNGGLCLVRPDGHIAYYQSNNDIAKLLFFWYKNYGSN